MTSAAYRSPSKFFPLEDSVRANQKPSVMHMVAVSSRVATTGGVAQFTLNILGWDSLLLLEKQCSASLTRLINVGIVADTCSSRGGASRSH